MDINRVFLIGRLTKDPNLSYTINGVALCKFSIAVQHGKNNTNKSTSSTQATADNSSTNDNVSFFDIIIWDKLAEGCHRYLQKSRQIAVEGYLKQNRYKTKNGESRYKINIVAQNVQFLNKKH